MSLNNKKEKLEQSKKSYISLQKKLWDCYIVSSEHKFHAAAAGIQILIQAAEELIKDKASEKMTADQLLWLYVIMLSATGVKLVLWIYCRSSGNKIVRAYANVCNTV